MVAIKFLGLILTFYLFVVLEAFGQNFYPARYGKRGENDSTAEKNLSEGKRLEGNEDREAIADGKMRFFISGGRFGKRDCSYDKCFQGSRELISDESQKRQDRSERIRIPIRKNQFMVGSRFGKRAEGREVIGLISPEEMNCIYTGISDYYRCSNKNHRDGSDFFNSNDISGFFE